VKEDDIDEAVIVDFIFNTDRKLPFREADLIKGIRTFRKYHLSKAQEAGELFFVLQATLRLNNVNVFIYSNPCLDFILTRLGFALFALDVDAPQRFSISEYSTLFLENADVAKSTYTSGVFVVNTDEVVADMMTDDVGLAWNTRLIKDVYRAARFGAGRIGDAVRCNYAWKDKRVITVGDMGETVLLMKWECLTYVAIDLVIPQVLSVRPSMGALSMPDWCFQLKHFSDFSEKCVKQMRNQLLIMSGATSSFKAKLVPLGSVASIIVAAPSGSGKSWLCAKYPQYFVDGDTMSVFPSGEFWLDKAKDEEVMRLNSERLTSFKTSIRGKVILTYIPHIADSHWIQTPDEIRRKLRMRDKDSGQPTDYDVEGTLKTFVGKPQGLMWLPYAAYWTNVDDIYYWLRFGEAWSWSCRTFWSDDDQGLYRLGMASVNREDADVLVSKGKMKIVNKMKWRGDWRPLIAIIRSYTFPVYAAPWSEDHFVMGFRIVRIGSVYYRLFCENDYSHAPPMSVFSLLERDDYMKLQLSAGSFIKADALHMQPKPKGYHVNAFFSISNEVNGKDSWLLMADWARHNTISFCFPVAMPCDAFIEKGYSRVIMVRKRDRIFVDTGTRKWVDYVADPARVCARMRTLGVELFSYTAPDFLTLLNTDEVYGTPQGFAQPCNPRDPYLNCWIFFSTMKPSQYPRPDLLNTQTWWVKVPSIVIRDYFREGQEDQRKLRGKALALMGIEPVFMEDGKVYGWDPETSRAVDVSGHAISMLICASWGVVDINRYWDTVIFMARMALGERDATYTMLIERGWLTEDALKSPFKLWHTVLDYRAAVYAYLVLAKERSVPINIWVLRSTLLKLGELGNIKGIQGFRRRDLDALIQSVRSARLSVGH
jgi:hypothetical protein